VSVREAALLPLDPLEAVVDDFPACVAVEGVPVSVETPLAGFNRILLEVVLDMLDSDAEINMAHSPSAEMAPLVHRYFLCVHHS